MSKSAKTTKANAVFLATVLVAGTLALLSPSFLTGAQAYVMDNNYKSYEPDYGKEYVMDSYKSKDSVSVSKIKCNSINVNLNDIAINALPTSLRNLVTELQAEDEGATGSSFSGNDGRSSDSHSDSKVVCINHNNNNGEEDGADKDKCADAVEACFAASLEDTELNTLTTALKSQAGVTVPIGAEILVFHSFADICEQLADRSDTDVQFIISELIQNAGLTIHPDTVAAIVACISLALEENAEV
jgi:hypothetical protein